MSAPAQADRKLVKPTPAELMEDAGTGLDYGTRPDRMPGYLVPNDRFYVRSHAPTPAVDLADWTLDIDGDGVRRPVSYRYDELWNRFPLVSVIRTIECAGNRRVLLGDEFAATFDGTQWGRGAIGTAEWTGVRLRDLLEPAGLGPGAREVMPESLDAIRARLPMPLAKARADDTIVALAMNGEILPADHGFPARMVVSGWLGAASIKWLARIEVSQRHLYVPWNTVDYVLIGPGYPSDGPARGPAITDQPISVLTELPWPARLRPEPQMIRGRAFAGEVAIAAVEYRIDDGPWRTAELLLPRDTGCMGAVAVRLDAGTGRSRPAGACHRRAGRHPAGRVGMERARVPPALGALPPGARRACSRAAHPYITDWMSRNVARGSLEPSAVNAHGHDAARADAYPRWDEAERGAHAPSGLLATVEVGFGLPADLKDARTRIVEYNGGLRPALSVAELLRRGHDGLAVLRIGSDDQGIGVRVVEDADRHDMRHPVGPDGGEPPESLTVHKLDLGIGERAHGSSVCRLGGACSVTATSGL